MVCPECNKDDIKVVDSRDSLKTIRRRRACKSCGHRWTTYEIPSNLWKVLPMIVKNMTHLSHTVHKSIDFLKTF